MIKNEIIDLLFNPSGSIGKRKYRAGFIILLFNTLLIHSSILIGFLYTTMMAHRYIPEDYGKYVLLTALFDMIKIHPQIIPYGFILFFSSFVLSFKRVRSLNMKPLIGLIAGFLTNLFLIALFRLFPLSVFYNEIFQHPRLIHQQELAVITGTILFISLAAILFLSGYGKSEKTNHKKEMNQLNYVFYIGKLLIIFCPVILILITLIAFNFLEVIDLSNPLLIIIISIMSILLILFFYFYIRGMVRRIDNAGYRRGLSLLVYFLFPICMSILTVVFLKAKIAPEQLIYLKYFFDLFFSVFLAFNFIPLILPDHKKV